MGRSGRCGHCRGLEAIRAQDIARSARRKIWPQEGAAHANRIWRDRERAFTELIDRILIFGERHLRTVLAAYGTHYNGRRPHRALSLLPLRPDHPGPNLDHRQIRRQPILGGLINEYERSLNRSSRL
jgi:hypothetical protein